jgi:hypothetical protein
MQNMSWDISIMNFPPVATARDIPDDWQVEPLGTRAEVTAKILEAVPTADFSDPAWGRIEGETFSIEVNIGADDLVISFMLHVRGGDEAIAVIVALVQRGGWRALDISTGEIFSGAPARGGFAVWRAYRDAVIPDAGPPGEPHPGAS